LNVQFPLLVTRDMEESRKSTLDEWIKQKLTVEGSGSEGKKWSNKYGASGGEGARRKEQGGGWGRMAGGPAERMECPKKKVEEG